MLQSLKKMIPNEDLEKWKQAGHIAAQALEYGRLLIKPGAKIRDVCDAVDKKIIELGAKPAWPTQVGCDEIAAHQTPDPDDDAIFENQVICLDVGAHVDGFVGDNAVSVDLSGKYSDLVKASKEALDTAIKMLAPGVEILSIGKAIQEVITSHGFSPVKNLTGHGISRWVIHDKPSMPNYATGTGVLKAGQIIAIEPFATNGKGLIEEAEQSNLFALGEKKPVRSPFAREIQQFVEKEYGPLPFTTRWLTPKFGKGKVSLALRELLQVGSLRSYPPLVEQARGMVTVCEKTMLIGENTIILTQI